MAAGHRRRVALFDANGQYVRSLANGAQLRLRQLDDGRFFVTGLPLQGVNPPKADRRSRRCAATCRARRRSRRTCARTSRPRRRRPRSTTRCRPCTRRSRARAGARDGVAATRSSTSVGVADPDRRHAARAVAAPAAREGAAVKRAIREHRGDFARDPRPDRRSPRRARLHPQQAAAALPAASRTSRSSSRASSRPARRSRPARARPSASRACASATSPRSSSRTAGRSSRWTSTEVQGPRARELDRAAAPEDRAQGHVHRADAGPRRGAAARRRAGAMPIASTLPDVNPDEFLAALDADTRDYLKLLLNGARGGLEGRADDLNAVLKRFEPTYRDIARGVGRGRRRAARTCGGLINSLDRLNTELGRKDDDLAAARRTRRPACSARSPPSASTSPRPCASCRARCAQTTDDARQGRAFARGARARRPTRLRPAVRALDRANAATLPFAREAAPLLRRDIRPFVREARPLVRELEPGRRTTSSRPTRRSSAPCTQLNRLFNLLAFNPNGREGAGHGGPRRGLPVLPGLARAPVGPAVLAARTPTASSARSCSAAPAT